MKINITARHFDLTPELREHVETEIEKLSRFFENIISTDVILDVEKYRQSAETKVKVFNAVITGSADSNDMYASIEKSVDKVKKQLKKYKDKLKEKYPEKITEAVENLTKPHTNEDEIDA